MRGYASHQQMVQAPSRERDLLALFLYSVICIMSANSMITPMSGLGSGIFPRLIFVHGPEQTTLHLDHTPFSVGRKMDKDLVIADPRVSRDHALLTSENGKFFVEDQGSKHGTFVNGERVDRKQLEPNDRLWI